VSFWRVFGEMTKGHNNPTKTAANRKVAETLSARYNYQFDMNTANQCLIGNSLCFFGDIGSASA